MTSLRGRWNRWFSPVPRGVPAEVREALVEFQHSRLHATATVLCLTLATNAIAMALAVRGPLPLWQQIAPPAAIVAISFAILAGFALRPRKTDMPTALRQLRRAVVLATILGTIAGAWCVNAFLHTQGTPAAIAPVFIAVAAMVGANCLTSVPRAAIFGMAGALGPVIAALLLQNEVALRAIAVVLTIVVFLKTRLAVARSQEAVVTLRLQHELDRLAHRDPLTGLANRRAFLEAARERTERGETIAVAVADLDRFKAANDRFGHHTGDLILKEVGTRMTLHAPSALSIARLGGDEFALLFDGRMPEARIAAELAAVRKAVALPHIAGKTPASVSLSLGLACPPGDVGDVAQLLQIADRRLYADKASFRSRRAIREFVPTSDNDPTTRGDRRRWRGR